MNHGTWNGLENFPIGTQVKVPCVANGLGQIEEDRWELEKKMEY
jgi:hypothetical protein